MNNVIEYSADVVS